MADKPIILDMTNEEIRDVFFVYDNKLKSSITKAKPIIFLDETTKVYRTASIGNICIQKEVSINGEINLCAISDADNCHHSTSNQYSVSSDIYVDNLIETALRLAFFISFGKPNLHSNK